MSEVLRFIIRLSIVFSLANLLPTINYLLEFNKNLGAYYLFFHLASLGLVIFWRNFRRRAAYIIVLLGLSSFYLFPLVPYWSTPDRAEASVCGVQPDACVTLKVLYANVEAPNHDFKSFVKLVRDVKPDLLGVLELTPEWRDALSQTSGELPHKIELPEPGCFGLGIYSRFPITGDVITSLGEETPSVIVADVEVAPERKLQLTLFHTFPVFSREAFKVDKLITRRLLTILKHNDREGILMADMNATVYSNYYTPFIWAAKFSNAMNGFGFQRSWNTKLWAARFAIDHVLYRGEMRVKSFRVLDAFGSDHFPILVEFEVPKRLTAPWKMPL